MCLLQARDEAKESSRKDAMIKARRRLAVLDAPHMLGELNVVLALHILLPLLFLFLVFSASKRQSPVLTECRTDSEILAGVFFVL